MSSRRAGRVAVGLVGVLAMSGVLAGCDEVETRSSASSSQSGPSAPSYSPPTYSPAPAPVAAREDAVERSFA